MKHLSQGQRARAGLLVALAYRPELLVLDEPSSGLDPIVRRDILGAIIRTIADEGRTVLFSSHLLDEVERVADHVALIDRGRVVFAGPLDDLKAAHHRLTVRFDEDRPQPPALAGALAWEGDGPRVDGRLPRAARRAAGGGRGGRRPGRRARRAVAGRDLRGPGRGEHHMKTPALAIGWTIWRRHRWGLIATAACVALAVAASAVARASSTRGTPFSCAGCSSSRCLPVHSTWPRCSPTGSTPTW